MKKIFLLSKDNLELAEYEAKALAKASNGEVYDNILVLDTKEERLWQRLAFTKKILDLLFVCDEKDLKKNIDEFDWNKIYEENFKVAVHCKENKCLELADLIWDKLKNPKVDVKYPRTVIEFFFKDGKVICGKLEREVEKDFMKRKSHLLPESHPTAMHPKLARALVNISGADTGDSVLDPFCGAGGILIEAGLMRFQTHGWDIDKIMLKRAQKNLEAFKVRRFHISEGDALSIDKKFDVVITDLPYGRNSTTKGKEVEELYSKFLELYYKYIQKVMVVVFPDFVDYEKLIKNSDWKIKAEFENYLHKSLTRKIVVLEK